jgi:magnesium transporter
VRAAEVAEHLEDRLDLRAERSSVAMLERLIVLRRDLLAFRRLAVAQQQVLRQLVRAVPQLGAHLSDAADNQREAVNMADATCDYIDGAIEAYRMRRDERVEGGIRRLAVLAGILGPLSLLVGLFGANFRDIPGVEYRWGFWIFLGVEIALALVALAYFRWRGLV